MNRTNLSLRGMFVATVASSLFALSVGCSSGEKPAAAAPVSLPETPRSLAATAGPIATSSVNNTRDLAEAQPETALDFKPTRDLDGGGGNGQSGQPLTYETIGAESDRSV